MNTHDETFKAMADATRRQILAALCQQSREAGELARLVGLAPNAVSFHLRALKSAELVNVRREGRYLRYSIEPGTVQAWREQVERLFPFDRPSRHHELRAARAVAAVEMPRKTVVASDDQLPTELL